MKSMKLEYTSESVSNKSYLRLGNSMAGTFLTGHLQLHLDSKTDTTVGCSFFFTRTSTLWSRYAHLIVLRPECVFTVYRPPSYDCCSRWFKLLNRISILTTVQRSAVCFIFVSSIAIFVICSLLTGVNKQCLLMMLRLERASS